MKKTIYLSVIVLISLTTTAMSQSIKKDIFESSAGNFSLSFLGHASLLLEIDSKTIFIDPWGVQTDYSKQPKADLIIITHEHQDHLDEKAIHEISKENTQIICNTAVYDIIKKGKALKNGDNINWNTITIEAVPAYNTSPGREKFHPKGRDNGYVLTIGDKKIYIAGDTEDIPEMSDLKNITIVVLPMNQPYTMTAEQVISSVERIKPKILYPYHTSKEDCNRLKSLMSSEKNTELRIRTEQ